MNNTNDKNFDGMNFFTADVVAEKMNKAITNCLVDPSRACVCCDNAECDSVDFDGGNFFTAEVVAKMLNDGLDRDGDNITAEVSIKYPTLSDKEVKEIVKRYESETKDK